MVNSKDSNNWFCRTSTKWPKIYYQMHLEIKEAQLVSVPISRTPIFIAVSKILIQFSVPVSGYYSITYANSHRDLEWISKHLEDFITSFSFLSDRQNSLIFRIYQRNATLKITNKVQKILHPYSY